MVYEGTIYRPPPEANSLLIQVTIGCAWNQCAFCNMYTDKQFRIRTMEEIKRDLYTCAGYGLNVRRIFLCDGNALVLPFDFLLEILYEIRKLFPSVESVRLYASAKDVLRKTPQELKTLAQSGLDMAYVGLETGSDQILREVNKGITKQEMIEAAHRLQQAGIQLYVSIIAGLGGQDNMKEHMTQTVDALNQMQPNHVAMLVLQIAKTTELYKKVQETSFRPITPKQVLWEMKFLIERLQLNDCYFTSGHVSNYVHINGHLPKDQAEMLAVIDQLYRQC